MVQVAKHSGELNSQLAARTKQETENIANILSELSDNATAAAGAVEHSVDAAGAQDEKVTASSIAAEIYTKRAEALFFLKVATAQTALTKAKFFGVDKTDGNNYNVQMIR